MLKIDQICPAYVDQELYDAVASVVQQYNNIIDVTEGKIYFKQAIEILKKNFSSDEKDILNNILKDFEKVVA